MELLRGKDFDIRFNGLYAILHSHWEPPLRDFDCESIEQRGTTELRNDYANMSCCPIRPAER